MPRVPKIISDQTDVRVEENAIPSIEHSSSLPVDHTSEETPECVTSDEATKVELTLPSETDQEPLIGVQMAIDFSGDSTVFTISEQNNKEPTTRTTTVNEKNYQNSAPQDVTDNTVNPTVRSVQLEIPFSETTIGEDATKTAKQNLPVEGELPALTEHPVKFEYKGMTKASERTFAKGYINEGDAVFTIIKNELAHKCKCKTSNNGAKGESQVCWCHQLTSNLAMIAMYVNRKGQLIHAAQIRLRNLGLEFESSVSPTGTFLKIVPTTFSANAKGLVKTAKADESRARRSVSPLKGCCCSTTTDGGGGGGGDTGKCPTPTGITFDLEYFQNAIGLPCVRYILNAGDATALKFTTELNGFTRQQSLNVGTAPPATLPCCDNTAPVCFNIAPSVFAIESRPGVVISGQFARAYNGGAASCCEGLGFTIVNDVFVLDTTPITNDPIRCIEVVDSANDDWDSLYYSIGANGGDYKAWVISRGTALNFEILDGETLTLDVSTVATSGQAFSINAEPMTVVRRAQVLASTSFAVGSVAWMAALVSAAPAAPSMVTGYGAAPDNFKLFAFNSNGVAAYCIIVNDADLAAFTGGSDDIVVSLSPTINDFGSFHRPFHSAMLPLREKTSVNYSRMSNSIKGSPITTTTNFTIL